MSSDDTERDWHPVKEAAYDVNHLYEEVESEAAKAHIEDAVISLKSALKAERTDNRVRIYNEDGEQTWRCPECDLHNPIDWTDCRDCGFVRSVDMEDDQHE